MKFIRILPIGLAVALSLFGDLSLFAGLVTQLGVVHLSLGEVGIILSVHRLVRIPGNLVVGSLQDRFGRRGLFGLGMLLAVLSTAAYGLVSGFWPFVLARVAWGAAWALINVCGTTMVLDQSSPYDRGRLAGFYSAWMWVGYCIGPLVGGLLTDALSFQHSMLICAALTGIGLGVSIFFVRETRPGKRAEIKGFEGLLGVLGLKNLGLYFKGGKRLSRFYLVFAAVQFAGDGVVLATLTLLLTERLGPVIPLGSWRLNPAAAGGIFIAGRAALAGFVSLGAGRLSDGAFGRRPRLLRLSLWVGLAGVGLLALANSSELILLGLGLNALSNGTGLAVLPALVRDHSSPEDLGRSLGAYAMAGDVGSTAGPALAFALAPSFGLSVVYGLCALLFVQVIFLIMREAKPPS